MVTRTRGTRGLWRAAVGAAVLACALLALGPAPAAAQSGTLYFLTVKRGVSNPGANSEDLFSNLEAVHGAAQDDRSVQPTALELDVYGLGNGYAGLGIGLEVLRYNHEWSFADGDRIHVRAKGVLFSLKAFLRLGIVFPFVGVGTGNYYVNFDQASYGVSLRDSPDSVFNVRAGLRVLLGRLGLLLEAGNTQAPLDIPTDAGRSTLELGGSYTNVGVSWVF